MRIRHKVDKQYVNKKISDWLVGSYITKLVYYITGWELLFISEKFNLSTVFTGIEIIEPKIWDKLIQASPINLISNSEHKDTLTAIVLFTALNSQPITYAEIDEKNNLIIEFENKSKILIPALDEIVDCTWILVERNGEEIMCEWGEIYLGNINENIF